MIALGLVVGLILGVMAGFIVAAFVAGQARPCPWCGEEPNREVLSQ